MITTIIMLSSLVLPHPFTAPHVNRRPTELNPNVLANRDPIITARFCTIDFMTHKAQMAATEQGRKIYADYLLDRRSNRMPIVGQMQQSTSFGYNISQTIPNPTQYSTPSPFYPSFVHSR